MTGERKNFVSRRAMLPIAATALASAAAIPAAANAAENPDAQLLQLIRRYNEADDAGDAFNPAFDAAQDRYERPPIPEALYARKSDPFPSYIKREIWLDCDRGAPSGRLGYENTAAENYFRVIYASASPDARERIDEITSAFEAWRAEADSRRQSSGLKDAEVEFFRLGQIATDLRAEVIATQAMTLPGLLAKAAIVARIFGPAPDCETFEGYTNRELESSGATGEAVARSIVCDLIEMLSKGSANV